MIRPSLQRKSALQKFYNLNVRDIKIRELELSEQEWLILRSKFSCLWSFEEATKIASGSTYTTSSKAYMLVKGLVVFHNVRLVNQLENCLKDQLLVHLKKYFIHNPKFNLECCQRAAFLDQFAYERMTLVEMVSARKSLKSLFSTSYELTPLGETELESLSEVDVYFSRFSN